ncbi:hypothetical protein [Salinimicrobium gaetbulicola]|uniref:Uncharacterized protein n=1 Tax=Salinimicrobium gaetbulicola TaxID=999702 RepID=A0ABW3IFW0_9FLAO
MDYNKLFEEKYRDTFQSLEHFVNNEFKSSKEDDEDERDYQETYNEVRSKIDDWKNQHFETSKLLSNLEIYRYFTSKNNKATLPEFLFPGVLGRKTKKFFLEKHSEGEYSSFIEDLAENKAYTDVVDIINNYDRYIELVYKDKKWKTIDLTKFDHNYQSAEYFINLHKKIYPPRNQSNGKKDYSLKIEQTKNLLNKFDEDEKVFLIKLFYDKYVENKNTLTRTEFIKFSHVISEIKDISIFYKQPQYSSTYNLFQKDYEYFSLLEDKNFFKILINKLNAVGLKSIKTQVKILESKY